MNWDNIKEAVGNSAPILGGLLGGPVGASVGTLISGVLGVKPTPEAVQEELRTNPEAVLKLKQIEVDHKEKIEEYKLKEKELLFKKFETSHESYQQKNTMADKIADQVIKYNLPVIALLVIVNVLVVHYFKDDASLIAIVSNIIGLAIGKLFSERQAVINFFFGSSIGSKEKDIQIASFKGK